MASAAPDPFEDTTVKTEETGTLGQKAQLRDLERERGLLDWPWLQSCLSRIEPFSLGGAARRFRQ